MLDRKGKENGTIFLTRPRCPLDPKPAFQQASPVGRGKRAFPSRRIPSSHRFPYGYLVTTSPQSKTPPWYAPIRPPKAFVALVVHRSNG